MRLTTLAVLAASLFLGNAVTWAESVEVPGRIYLGTEFDGPADEWSAFFTADSGFITGATSHTNTICVSDSNLEVCYELTAEAFDANGAPAGLFPNLRAVGVGSNGEIDPGESVKFTLESVAYNVLTPPLADFTSVLDQIDMAGNFDEGTDMYTYSGAGAPLAMDDVRSLIVGAEVTGGDMWTITGDVGDFRVLFLSLDTSYSVVPEPRAVTLMVIGILGVWRRRR